MSDKDIIDVQAVEVEEVKIDEAVNEEQEVKRVQKEIEENISDTVKQTVEEESLKKERFSTSFSGSKTYSSVNRGNDSFGEYSNTYTASHNNNEVAKVYKSDAKNKKISNKTLCIILALVTCPIWIPIIFSILGILCGVFFGFVGIIFGISFAGLGILVAGVTVFVAGILKLMITPLLGVTLTGIGLLLAGGGLLFTSIVLGIATKVIPWVGSLIGNFIGWFFGVLGGKKNE